MRAMTWWIGALAVAIILPACKTVSLFEPEQKSVAMEQTAHGSTTPDQPNIPLPVYAVGQTWTYSDGYAITVSDVGADGRARFVRTDVDDQWFVRRAFFREESQSRTAHRLVVFRTGDPMALFSKGFNDPHAYIREYTRNGDLVRHRTSWTIEGRETITVPAGTFETWVVVMRTQSVDSNWQGYERWYYSPDVNGYVRLEFKYGETPDGARVLMSYGDGNSAT